MSSPVYHAVFPAICQTIADLSRFNGYGGHPSSWIFFKHEILTADKVSRVTVYYLTKFLGDKSNRCWNMAI